MPDTLTTDQAAAEANVSRQHIAAEIAAGRLQANKLDPSKATSPYLIQRKSFTQWLASKLKKKKRAQTLKV